MSIQRIAVLGGGAWGTALALTCARAGREVTLWEHDAGNAEQLSSKRESQFLPGVRLDEHIKVTRDLGEARTQRRDSAGGAGAGDAFGGQARWRRQSPTARR